MGRAVRSLRRGRCDGRVRVGTPVDASARGMTANYVPDAMPGLTVVAPINRAIVVAW